MVRRITVRLDESADGPLLAAIDAMPAGSRNTEIRDALQQVFVEAPSIAAAVNRLADVLEHLPAGIVPSEIVPSPHTSSLSERMKDPAEKERIKAGLLGGFEK